MLQGLKFVYFLILWNRGMIQATNIEIIIIIIIIIIITVIIVLMMTMNIKQLFHEQVLDMRWSRDYKYYLDYLSFHIQQARMK